MREGVEKKEAVDGPFEMMHPLLGLGQVETPDLVPARVVALLLQLEVEILGDLAEPGLHVRVLEDADHPGGVERRAGAEVTLGVKQRWLFHKKKKKIVWMWWE